MCMSLQELILWAPHCRLFRVLTFLACIAALLCGRAPIATQLSSADQLLLFSLKILLPIRASKDLRFVPLQEACPAKAAMVYALMAARLKPFCGTTLLNP